jgi:hypothetical protein
MRLFIAAVALAAGCSSDLPPYFACTGDGECGSGGHCEPDGACSFVDDACVSGRRYGELSADDLAGACVPMCVRAEPFDAYSVCENGCSAQLTGRDLVSHIPSAVNGDDHAYGTTTLGSLGVAGRVWLRASIRLKLGQVVTPGHWLYILRSRYTAPPDVVSRVWGLFVAPDNALGIAAYADGDPTELIPGVTVPNDGSYLTVEIAAAVNDSITVRAGDSEITVDELAGMPPAQTAIDVGISHYDGVNAEAIDAVLRDVDWSAFDWVSSCPTP